MTNVTLPEIILLETLQAAINFVRKDYDDNSDKTKSYVYRLLNGASLEKYNMYEQALEVICGKNESPRAFEIDLAFNMKKSHLPSAHITLPTEMPGQNGMGTDEGYADYDDTGGGSFSDPDHNEDFDTGGHTFRRAVFARRKNATYNVVIMSDNSNEVVLLYHFLTAMLIALIPHLHMKGLQNVSFGGQDLNLYETVAPGIHMRAIVIQLQYDTFVPSIFPTELIGDVEVAGKPLAG